MVDQDDSKKPVDTEKNAQMKDNDERESGSVSPVVKNPESNSKNARSKSASSMQSQSSSQTPKRRKEKADRGKSAVSYYIAPKKSTNESRRDRSRSNSRSSDSRDGRIIKGGQRGKRNEIIFETFQLKYHSLS